MLINARSAVAVVGLGLGALIYIGLPVLASAGIHPSPEMHRWSLSLGAVAVIIGGVALLPSRRAQTPPVDVDALADKVAAKLKTPLAEEIAEAAEDGCSSALRAMHNEYNLDRITRGEIGARANGATVTPIR